MFKIAKIMTTNANPCTIFDNGVRYDDVYDAMESLGNIEGRAVKNGIQIDSNYSHMLTTSEFDEHNGRTVIVYCIMEVHE